MSTLIFAGLFFLLILELILVRLAPPPLGLLTTPEGNTTVDNTPPVAVNMTSPTSGSETTSTPTFEWSESEDANGQNVTYYLIIDDSSDFSSVDRNITSLATTTYTLTSGESLSAGTYYWRVDAFDSIDFNSSESWNFTAAAAGPGGPGGGGGRGPKEINFTVDPEEISLKLFLNETKTLVLYVKNLKDEAKFNVKQNLGDFLNISEDAFSLKAGALQTIFLTVKGLSTGVHTGEIEVKADGVKKAIPVLIEVETRERYFDVSLEVPEWSLKINPGDDVYVRVNLFALYEGSYEVENVYGVKDNQGSLVASSEETMVVEGNTSFLKKLNLPVNIETKDYVAFVEVRYLDTVATSTDKFKVVPVTPADYMMPAAFLLLIIGVIIVSRRVVRLTREKEFVRYGRIKKIVEKRRLERNLAALEKAWKAKAISRETYLKTRKTVKQKLKRL